MELYEKITRMLFFTIFKLDSNQYMVKQPSKPYTEVGMNNEQNLDKRISLLG